MNNLSKVPQEARPEARPTLSIVIPAFNEEGAIAAILERSLAARDSICADSKVAGVEIIVVDDGSTDQTGAIARRFPEAKVISHDKNRGYGAAIKSGFEQATGDILGFLDADGSCDPRMFGRLCRALQTGDADIVIGARLGKESEMPLTRHVGNRLYAAVLNLWGAGPVTDSASGMRVVRRSALGRLYPLPDGMHFTPAMSSIALFDQRLRIEEVPIPYSERIGESKLHVTMDGIRFLSVIVDTALSYRPNRFFGTAGLMLMLVALGYGIRPLMLYVTGQPLPEWMFYRLSFVAVAIAAGTTLVMVGLLAQQIVSIIHEDYSEPSGSRGWLHRSLFRRIVPLGVISMIAGVALNAQSVVSYITTGHVTAHWIRIVVGGLLVGLGIQGLAFGVLARTLNILVSRKRFVSRDAGE